MFRTTSAGLVNIHPATRARGRKTAGHVRLVSTGSDGIYAYQFDDTGGWRMALQWGPPTHSRHKLLIRRVICAVNELDNYEGAGPQKSGSVTSFAVDAAAAKLTSRNRRAARPCHLELDKTGRFLAVANYTGGNFSPPVTADGRLDPSVAVVAGQGRGPTKRQEGPHGHAVTFDANRFLISQPTLASTACLFIASIPRQAAGPVQPPSVAMSPGAGPRHFAFHPNNRQAFVINELNSTMQACA